MVNDARLATKYRSRRGANGSEIDEIIGHIKKYSEYKALAYIHISQGEYPPAIPGKEHMLGTNISFLKQVAVDEFKESMRLSKVYSALHQEYLGNNPLLEHF